MSREHLNSHTNISREGSQSLSSTSISSPSYTNRTSSSPFSQNPIIPDETTLPSPSATPFSPPQNDARSHTPSSGAESFAANQKALRDREREDKISRALVRVNEGLSYRQAAKEIGISFGTVYGRFRGRKSRIRAQEVRMKLSFLEETIIEKVLLSLMCIGKPATQPFFVHTVNMILQAQGDSGAERVTRQWYRHFRRRHPSIDARDFSSLHNPPPKTSTSELSAAWFSHFESVCRSYRVLPENIYAMDELGYAFSVGFSSSTEAPWQTTLAQTSSATSNGDISSFITGPSCSSGNGSISSGSISSGSAASTNDGVTSISRLHSSHQKSATPPAISMSAPPSEFFMSMETTCGDGSSLPPYLVHQADLSEKLNAEYPNGWKIHTSKSGWLNEQIMLHWIKRHFDPLTESKAKGNHRVLILDTHVGHFSLPFLQYGIDHNITFMYAPPHMPGLLPLDISPVSDLRQDISGTVPEFQHAINQLAATRNQKLSTANVKRSWRHAGLIPFDPSMARHLSLKSHSSGHTNAPLTPITDEYDSSSSTSSFTSQSQQPSTPTSRYVGNKRTILRYIPVRDLNYDSLPSSIPVRSTSPSSSLPLFPDSPRSTIRPEDIVNEFSAFDINSYAPSPAPFFDSRSGSFSAEMDGTDTGSTSPASTSYELSQTIAKSIETMLKNKTLGEHSLLYHQFLAGFMTRLQVSLDRLSESLKNRGPTVSEELSHLSLLANELRTVDSYGKDLSSQILPAVSANITLSGTLERIMKKAGEFSHKRGIASVGSRSSGDDVRYQERGDTIEGPTRGSNNPGKNHKSRNSRNDDVHHYRKASLPVSINNPFALPAPVAPTSDQQRNQQYLPQISEPDKMSISYTSEQQQYENYLPQHERKEQKQDQQDSFKESATIDTLPLDSKEHGLSLPSLSSHMFNGHNTLLPPLQFNQADAFRATQGGPTSLAQYSQGGLNEQKRRQTRTQ